MSLVCPSMKVAFSEEPPLPFNYDIMWNQQKVLEYLDNLGPIELLMSFFIFPNFYLLAFSLFISIENLKLSVCCETSH